MVTAIALIVIYRVIAVFLYVANGYITLSAHHRLITIFAFLSPQNYELSAQGNL